VNSPTRYSLLAVLSLTLLAAAPLAQARDRHVDVDVSFGLPLPPFIHFSNRHDQHAPYPNYYQPRVVSHYHGRQLCHLRHEAEGGYGHDQHYGHRPHYRDHHYRDNHHYRH